jgi:hypothetical protein
MEGVSFQVKPRGQFSRVADKALVSLRLGPSCETPPREHGSAVNVTFGIR